MTAPVRAVIAEDLALLREGLVRLLEENGVEVLAAAEDATALRRAVDTHRPDVAIVDVRLPPTFRDEGIRAAVELRQAHPDLAVLILSQYVEQTYAAELLADGRGAVDTCSRTASPMSATSSRRCGGSRRAARRWIPRWSRSCSRAGARTTRWRSSPPASARCCR